MRSSYSYDLTGKVFGKLTVIKKAEKVPGEKVKWVCVCTCGETTRPRTADLIAKKSTACRRCNSKKHGHTSSGGFRSREYGSWLSMRSRCIDPKATGFHRYGGRGITYCPEWNNFSTFFNDMGERPEGKTLDRIDNNGNYCKSNCKWSTAKEQAMNKEFTEKHRIANSKRHRDALGKYCKNHLTSP